MQLSELLRFLAGEQVRGGNPLVFASLAPDTTELSLRGVQVSAAPRSAAAAAKEEGALILLEAGGAFLPGLRLRELRQALEPLAAEYGGSFAYVAVGNTESLFEICAFERTPDADAKAARGTEGLPERFVFFVHPVRVPTPGQAARLPA